MAVSKASNFWKSLSPAIHLPNSILESCCLIYSPPLSPASLPCDIKGWNHQIGDLSRQSWLSKPNSTLGSCYFVLLFLLLSLSNLLHLSLQQKGEITQLYHSSISSILTVLKASAFWRSLSPAIHLQTPYRAAVAFVWFSLLSPSPYFEEKKGPLLSFKNLTYIGRIEGFWFLEISLTSHPSTKLHIGELLSHLL